MEKGALVGRLGDSPQCWRAAGLEFWHRMLRRSNHGLGLHQTIWHFINLCCLFCVRLCVALLTHMNLYHLILSTPERCYTNTILQMKKLRFREAQQQMQTQGGNVSLFFIPWPHSALPYSCSSTDLQRRCHWAQLCSKQPQQRISVLICD